MNISVTGFHWKLAVFKLILELLFFPHLICHFSRPQSRSLRSSANMAYCQDKRKTTHYLKSLLSPSFSNDWSLPIRHTFFVLIVLPCWTRLEPLYSIFFLKKWDLKTECSFWIAEDDWWRVAGGWWFKTSSLLMKHAPSPSHPIQLHEVTWGMQRLNNYTI